ncbi:putative metal-dependent HD superfamily phosphohydrolase [Pontibacter aydingkolensis]|uniref:HD domain-containing protein n=1 Tax=Pontibacter aydingkolensis TaxID=1911536 RepID=A0ABS7CXV0_9BACT|nr:HD domain-containing protein [Pontibacter aydingkolensis]MBW7468669.1 HD domain-containing protein [Pontibacter aydingkolensis]
MAENLKQQWETLCGKYTTDTTLVNNLWEELEKAYTSKSRHYHNLDHLAYMLELAEKYKHDAIKYESLQFAIFYHDIFYSPTRSDNEEKSAELAAKKLAKIGLNTNDIASIKEMIVATKAHQEHPDVTTNFLLDLDLAILGAGWQKYNVYRQAVRKEYSIYPDLVYKPGRRKVLQHFLSQQHIYKTPFFRERLELQARENLRMELDMLG